MAISAVPVGRVLITGASGYLGRPLLDRLGAERTIGLFCKTPVKGGVRFDAISQTLEDVVDDWSAITHGIILHADSNPNSVAENVARADTLNIASCIRVVDSLRRHAIIPVFASSEAVFGQNAAEPYREDVRPEPCFAYGRQKLAVEDHIAASCEKYLIVRIARVYGSDAGDPTGYESWIATARKGGEVVCADDQTFAPACRDDAVEGIARLIERGSYGIYNLPGERPIRRIDLLNMFLEEVAKVRPVQVKVVPRPLAQFPVKEARPNNSVLDGEKIRRDTGLVMTPYRTIFARIAAPLAGDAMAAAPADKPIR